MRWLLGTCTPTKILFLFFYFLQYLFIASVQVLVPERFVRRMSYVGLVMKRRSLVLASQIEVIHST